MPLSHDVIAILNFSKDVYLLQKSDRAFLHTSSPMSWAEAEDFCQTMYGHLATDDSAGELRQVKYFFSWLPSRYMFFSNSFSLGQTFLKRALYTGINTQNLNETDYFLLKLFSLLIFLHIEAIFDLQTSPKLTCFLQLK